MIQYSEALVIEPKSCGILDTPLEPVIGLAGGETRWRSMTVFCAERIEDPSHRSRHDAPRAAALADPGEYRHPAGKIRMPSQAPQKRSGQGRTSWSYGASA